MLPRHGLFVLWPFSVYGWHSFNYLVTICFNYKKENLSHTSPPFSHQIIYVMRTHIALKEPMKWCVCMIPKRANLINTQFNNFWELTTRDWFLNIYTIKKTHEGTLYYRVINLWVWEPFIKYKNCKVGMLDWALSFKQSTLRSQFI